MAVVPRKRSNTVTYYVTFGWNGKTVWERSGTDEREAVRLEARRKLEVARGTYVPPGQSKATTVRQYAIGWLKARTNRTAKDDRRWMNLHVLSRAWFADMPLEDVRPRHMNQLVAELKAGTSGKGMPFAGKSISNIFGLVRTMFRDARIADLIAADPCILGKGAIPRGRKTRRVPYEVAEVQALTGSLVTPAARVWNALAFFTGMREGEVCGRRFRHWDRATSPLGCLTVDTQYNDQPLKTDEEHGDHPRHVPVHAALAATLEWWWGEGFAMTYGRAPTSEDFIVPRARHLDGHTRSTAYKAWRKSCAAAGVTSHTLHSTRHTFISLSRRAGARKEVVEQITHSAAGDIVDAYTKWDWAPLCEAVSLLDLGHPSFDVPFDGPQESPTKGHVARASIPGASTAVRVIQGESAFGAVDASTLIHAESDDRDGSPAAGQKQVLRGLARGVANLRAIEDDFDRLWAEDLGIALGGAT